MRKKGFTCSVIKLRFVLLLLFALSTAATGLKAQASLDSLGNFWSIVPGQSNKEIRVVSIDSSGFIYLSVWGEGLLRSTNNGTDWVNITNDLTFKNISAIEFDSTGKIYLGTLGGGVFYSTNNGNNWLEANNGLTNKRITTLKIEKGGPMYVGTVGSGVFRSSNGGQNWTQLVSSLRADPADQRHEVHQRLRQVPLRAEVAHARRAVEQR